MTTPLETLSAQIEAHIKAWREVQSFVASHAEQFAKAGTLDLDTSTAYIDGQTRPRPRINIWRLPDPKSFCRAIGGDWIREPEYGRRVDYHGQFEQFSILIFDAEPLPEPEPLFSGELSSAAVS